MASTDKPAPEALPPPEVPPKDFVVADVILRLLLLAAAVTAVAVMATGKQTKMAPLPVTPFRPTAPAPAPTTVEFDHAPALVYFVAALSVAGLYSIITMLASFFVLMKPDFSTQLLYPFLVFDVLMLGIVAAATGAGGAVAYIGLNGNSHLGWNKICDVYDKFCRYTAGSLAVSLFASIVLALLVILSAYSLSKKTPN